MKYRRHIVFAVLLLVVGFAGFSFAPEKSLGATILYPSRGGTGAGTIPSYGQVLVGNSSGTYTLTATSSLGISGGSGLTSLNGQTGATQTFASSSSAINSGPGIVSSGDVHTFYWPDASASNRGFLTSADWTTFNNKAGFSYLFPSNATTTSLAFNGGLTFTQATGTNVYASGSSTFQTLHVGALDIPALTSALLLTDGSGLLAEYAGAGCTNQVVEDISALGASTCVSINNGYWSGTDLSVANGGTGLSTFGGTNTILYTTAADTLSSEAAFTYAPSTNTLTADNHAFVTATGTSLYLSASSTLQVFRSTDATISGSLVIPNNGTVNANGEITADDTSGQFRYYAGSAERVIPPTGSFRFNYGSTTQGSGTTTRRLGTAPFALTVTTVECDFSNFMDISLYDGTNRANLVKASSTVGTFTYSTNNTFTASEVIRLDIGTTTNIAAAVDGGCTFKYTPTAD